MKYNSYTTSDSESPNYSLPDFINNNEGFLVFGNAALYSTKDGGINWNEVTSSDYWRSILKN